MLLIAHHRKGGSRFGSSGTAKPIKDLVFYLDFTSLVHMMQKLTTYEHYHPDLYKERFKRHVNVAQADDSDNSSGEQEVAVAEWARGETPSRASGSNRRGL